MSNYVVNINTAIQKKPTY